MDNQNNSNLPNNPIPASPPVPPDQTVVPPNPWAPPVPPEPIPSTPLPASPLPPTNTWPATTAPTESIPTFTPPPSPIPTNPVSIQTEEPKPISPLDNPWGTQATNTTQPSWTTTTADATQQNTLPNASLETAPTDLSHLIGNNHSSEQSTVQAPESLVVPSTPAPNPDIPTIPETHKGIPKWLLGLGGGLLILVIGASAYFILGIGQPSRETTSLPAATKTAEVKPPPPIATPAPQPSAQPVATSSANFGQLGGSGNTQATSAADLLRPRR